MKLQRLIVLAMLLLLPRCGEDSKNPLSDPTTSKPDERLVGLWRLGGAQGADDYFHIYFHIGHAGEKFPKSVMRVLVVRHTDAGLDPPGECLVFPTVLGGKTYLSMASDAKQVKHLDEEGWKTGAVECYTFVKYQLDGDKLLVWLIEELEKEQAIKSGKIKGVSPWNEPARSAIHRFTDTTEHLARFVSDAGNGLWRGPWQLDRVEAAKKR
jgi:hypothetical protein